MQVTATEFKTHLRTYLELVEKEDIWISKNGKVIAKLVNPNVSAVDSITGLLKDKVSVDLTAADLREERISKYAAYD